jgi:SAM-dependent methyltransferase
MGDSLLGTSGDEYFVRSTCRLCGAEELECVLEMESTPPANEFLSAAQNEEAQDTFPLGLWQCRNCGHVQLPVVVNPERLFRDYVYVSGTSSVFVDHFRRYAKSVVENLDLKPGSLVIDVGSNDGTLLRYFKEAGMRILGIDPARDIAAKATAEGLDTIPEFLDEALARAIVEERGPAAVVTANNVFAHIDDLAGAARAVRALLAGDGVFVFEVYYLVDFTDKMLFDTVYHEHLSYHSMGPLIPFFQSLDMNVFDVERVPTHGGSLRVYVDLGRRARESRVNELLNLEWQRGFFVPGMPPPEARNPLVALDERIQQLRERLTARIQELRAAGKRLAGYGAPAKATTLMYQFQLGRDALDYIVDDNPLKQNLFTPGKRIPVVSSSVLEDDPPDYLLILAWNFAESIIEKCHTFRDRGGKFIVPLPELTES